MKISGRIYLQKGGRKQIEEEEFAKTKEPNGRIGRGWSSGKEERENTKQGKSSAAEWSKKADRRERHK